VNALEALWRCQRAWERSQPQLFLELWPDDGLDAGQPSALLCVEPAVAVASPEAGGLASRLTAGAGSREVPSLGSVPEGSDRADSPAVSRVLNPGAEPCRGDDRELTVECPASPLVARSSPAAPPAGSGGSAHSHNTPGPHALPPKRTRAAQEVTL
jgi:hypothetical protein